MNELFRTAVHLTGDRDEAQDLLQQTYLIACRAFHRFEAGTNCRAWLFKIMYNEFKHQRRGWFRSKVVQESEDHSLEDTLTYEAPVQESLTDPHILAALDTIPREYREVLLLVDVQEFAYKEVAEIVGAPIGTVMSRLSRGRKALRLQLTQSGELQRGSR
jgi:RNA polymerase sigma-70 factor (ECF subfamily)